MKASNLKMIFIWLFTVLLGVLAMWFINIRLSQPKNLPPGPTLPQLLRDIWPMIRGRTDQLAIFSSWARRYGDIMSFYIGPKPIIILNSYPVIADAFNHADLQDRPQSGFRREVYGNSHSIALANGRMWKEQRKFIQSVFRSLGVGKRTYEDIIAAEMTLLVSAVKQKHGAPFNPAKLFGTAVANITCSIVFGTQYQYDNEELQHLLDIIYRIFRLNSAGGAITLLQVPGISKIPFGIPNKLVKTYRNLQKFCLLQIDAHEKNLDPDSPKDFIDQYLNKLAGIEGTSSSFSKPGLAQNIHDLFGAGTESTTTTLTWCILYMMAYPRVQSRVQEELDHVIGRERLPVVDEQKELPYTNAVLLEIQRMAAVAPLGIIHVAAADCRLQGYVIPQGAIIVPNIWEVLHNEKSWTDAEVFNPERFLGPDGKLVKRDELIFFSTGRRMCPGKQLAEMEIFLAFTSLLHRFTFTKPDDSPPLCFKGVLGLARMTTPYMTCAVPR